MLPGWRLGIKVLRIPRSVNVVFGALAVPSRSGPARTEPAGGDTGWEERKREADEGVLQLADTQQKLTLSDRS